ncbi:MAG: [Fe-Fe] hydrogenase large subunit C-terminal domain-containing protein, partial [Thermoguttaceae bacterium]|nr:[Fe-Fe] hydrogenase large subunit C-terminal domain-containing protein [Thermoguttaceae bacterium]
EALSAETCEYLRTTDRSLVISSACPSVVDYIRKYYPQYTSSLVPFASPIVSHCRIMRKRYGSDIKVVFFGPCAAKKNESDRNRGILDLALTFTDLETLLAELNIELRSESETGDVVVDRGAEGRFYSIEGGMNDTLRDGNSRVRYLAVSGLDNLSRLLNCRPGVQDGRVIYLEALACHGGCVNGPVMPANSSSLDVLFRTDENSDLVSSHGKTPDVSIASEYREDSLPDWDPPEEEIQKALARVGKYGKSDELNCGACGYNTCRDFARALLRDKAEEAMCHNYLRRNYQRTSNALIKYIPAAVVIVDDKLCVTECNRNFAELTGDTEIYDSLGGLDSLSIQICFSEYADLFSSVLENGGEIEKYNQKFKDRIINISVFTVAKGKYAGAVVSDVTRKEFHREQIAAKAREVIQKNVLTVQQVARLFGEHIAETEIMLNEIAGSYESENEASHE